jgi:hypothetical protein
MRPTDDDFGMDDDYVEIGTCTISPTKRVVEFGGVEFLVEAVYDDQELRRLIPDAHEILGDIKATRRCHEDADRLGEEVSEWDEPSYLQSPNYGNAVRDRLIDAGCIVAEENRDETAVVFNGLAAVLKEAFDVCVELAEDREAVFRIVTRELPAPVGGPRQSPG